MAGVESGPTHRSDIYFTKSSRRPAIQGKLAGIERLWLAPLSYHISGYELCRVFILITALVDIQLPQILEKMVSEVAKTLQLKPLLVWRGQTRGALVAGSKAKLPSENILLLPFSGRNIVPFACQPGFSGNKLGAFGGNARERRFDISRRSRERAIISEPDHSTFDFQPKSMKVSRQPRRPGREKVTE
jgi:hypothetical protein